MGIIELLERLDFPFKEFQLFPVLHITETKFLQNGFLACILVLDQISGLQGPGGKFFLDEIAIVERLQSFLFTGGYNMLEGVVTS